MLLNWNRLDGTHPPGARQQRPEIEMTCSGQCFGARVNAPGALSSRPCQGTRDMFGGGWPTKGTWRQASRC